jgi:hypothetical protein
MGSKLRKLRKEAGVTGRAWLAEQRRLVRQRELITAGYLAVCVHCGDVVAPSRRLTLTGPGKTLCSKCEPHAVRYSAVRPGPPALEVVINAGMGPMTIEQLMDTGGLPLAVEVPPDPHVKTTVRGDGAPAPIVVDMSEISAAAAIAQGAPFLVGEPDTRRPPASALALSRRMPLLAQVALMSMILAGGEPPKGDR